MTATLQALYDSFHADMARELVDAEHSPAAREHYARANAYCNARDAVMRAAHYALEPAE